LISLKAAGLIAGEMHIVTMLTNFSNAQINTDAKAAMLKVRNAVLLVKYMSNTDVAAILKKQVVRVGNALETMEGKAGTAHGFKAAWEIHAKLKVDQSITKINRWLTDWPPKIVTKHGKSTTKGLAKKVATMNTEVQAALTLWTNPL
jgi:hypothetical protein